MTRTAFIALIAFCMFLWCGAPAAQPSDFPWPMFQYDAQHTGRSPCEGPPVPLLNWSYSTIGPVSVSPSIRIDRTIYTGSRDGNIYFLENDGHLVWSYRCFDVTSDQFFSPAIDVDDRIYFGSNNNNFYALEPYGTLYWSYAAAGAVRSSPVIDSAGMIYFGCAAANLYAIGSDGSFHWSYAATGGSSRSSPAISPGGKIHLGSGDNNIYTFNADGKLSWSYLTGNDVLSSPSVGSDGRIYCGSIDWNLYAINPGGTLSWSYLIAPTFSSPAIDGHDRIYTGSFDRNIYAIHSDGSLGWSYTSGSQIIYSSAAIGLGGKIFVGSDDNNVYALNPDGMISWSYETGGDIHSSPAICPAGNLYIGSEDGSAYCLGLPPAPTLTQEPVTLKDYVYVCNTGYDDDPGNTVSVIDVEMETVVETITVPEKPQDIAGYAGTGFITSSSGDGAISIFSTDTNEVTDTFETAGKPVCCLIPDDGSYLYSEILVHDKRVVGRFPLPDYGEPALFTPVGAGLAFKISLYSYYDLLLVPDYWDDAISVIAASSMSDLGTVHVGEGRRPTAVSRITNGRFALVANYGEYAGWGNIGVIDILRGKLVASLQAGEGPMDVAIDPLMVYAYVTNYDEGTVSKIDMLSGTVVETVAVGEGPGGIDVHPSGEIIYVANFFSSTVTVIDFRNGRMKTIAVGPGPRRLSLCMGDYLHGVKIPASPHTLERGESVSINWEVNPGGMPGDLSRGDVLLGVRKWPGVVWSFNRRLNGLTYWGRKPDLNRIQRIATDFDFSLQRKGSLEFTVGRGIAPGVYVFVAAIVYPGSSEVAYLVQSNTVVVK